MQSRKRRLPLWVPIVLLLVVVAFTLIIVNAYQTSQHDAAINAATLAYEIRLTVAATLTK